MQTKVNEEIKVTVETIPADLTLGQLIEKLDRNEDRKAPSARKLLNSETPILLGVEIGGITIKVYQDGHVLFIRKAPELEEYETEKERKKDHMSVKKVESCASIWYDEIITDEEMKYERQEGCRPVKRFRDGVEESYMVVGEEQLLGLPWYFVLFEVGQIALDHNQEERENSKIEEYLKCDGDEIDEDHTMLPGFEQAYFDEEQMKIVRLARQWNAKKAIDSLTDRQREVVERIANKEKQEDIAKAMGIQQSAVSTHLKRAKARIERSMRENQKYFEEKAEKVLSGR